MGKRLPGILRRTKSFHDAVVVLGTLQGSSAVLEGQRRRLENPAVHLQAMDGFLQRTGHSVEELDKLRAIHVTGTKGKGSTCAFTEAILRNCGFRTGFFSSPHLVHVRERIRINGQPISKELFTKYFWEAYQRLNATKEVHGDSMPFYFQFLTLLAFHVFLQEKVDVAVIEVGIGGEYDCTNIFRKSWVCGITSLGLDHSSLLGDTVEKIAWQKAGIFKPGVPAFTDKQPPKPLRVLQSRAEEIGCPLLVCPALEEFEASQGPLQLGLAGLHQRRNASLALQLSNSWLQRWEAQTKPEGSLSTPTVKNVARSVSFPFQPSPPMLKGLRETKWPGRSQVMRCGPVTYYLDGAHNAESMQACVRWFEQETALEDQSLYGGPGVKVLLFNTTGERDPAPLLKLLLPCQFDYAAFCPNITETPAKDKARQDTGRRCLDNQSSWLRLTGGALSPHPRHHQQVPHHCPLVAHSGSRSLVFPCIHSALQWIGQGTGPGLPRSAGEGAARTSVLVTGSLHLVGGALELLHFSLSS